MSSYYVRVLVRCARSCLGVCAVLLVGISTCALGHQFTDPTEFSCYSMWGNIAFEGDCSTSTAVHDHTVKFEKDGRFYQSVAVTTWAGGASNYQFFNGTLDVPGPGWPPDPGNVQLFWLGGLVDTVQV